METKSKEIQAEDLIKHKLLKYGFLVTKPSFDILGADLLIVENISRKVTPFIKIQCKGRTVGRNSNVSIPEQYIDDNFILFLYLEVKDSKNDFVYVFFAQDLRKWNYRGGQYKLAIPSTFQEKQDFQNKLFSENDVMAIKKMLANQAVNSQIHPYNSILIDGIFLEKAIRNSTTFYRELYPDKEFKKPNIYDLIVQLSKYGQIDTGKSLNCFLIYSADFTLDTVIEIDSNDSGTEQLGIASMPCCNLYKFKTNEIVSFKVEEQLERVLNTDNILLVADDPAYMPGLQVLKAKGIEIKIAQMKGDFGSTMYHEFRYTDIMLPIGIAIGLQSFEL